MPKNNSNNSNDSNNSKNSQPPSYSCSFAAGVSIFFLHSPTPPSDKKSEPKTPLVQNSHNAGHNSGLNQCVHGPFSPWQ